MAISTGNRPKGLIVGMSAVDTVSPADGPPQKRPKAALRFLKPAKPKRRAKAKGSTLLAAVTKAAKGY